MASSSTNSDAAPASQWHSTLCINILDTSFTIQTNEAPDHLNKIYAYLKKEIDTMQKSTNMKDPLKLSILTGLALVNALFQAKAGQGTASTDTLEVEEITMRLIAEIDNVIKEPMKGNAIQET